MLRLFFEGNFLGKFGGVYCCHAYIMSVPIFARPYIGSFCFLLPRFCKYFEDFDLAQKCA